MAEDIIARLNRLANMGKKSPKEQMKPRKQVEPIPESKHKDGRRDGFLMRLLDEVDRQHKIKMDKLKG